MPLHRLDLYKVLPFSGLLYYNQIDSLARGLGMAMERRTLSIELPLPLDKAELVEQVARLRTGQTDPQGPVDLGAYIWALLNRDITTCLEEIRVRRGA